MKIKTYYLSFLLIFSLLAANVQAAFVTKETAQTVAKNFINERILNNQVGWTANSIDIQYYTTLYDQDNQPAIYVFTNKNQGFILVSADDALTPVLGYAYEGIFPSKGVNPNFDSFLGNYLAQAKYARVNSVQATNEVATKWNNYKFGELTKNPRATTDLEPLVTLLWNQDYPYNILCPEDPLGSGGHVYSGCVAETMAVIMQYYRYPIKGIGQHSYYAQNYGVQTANFGETYYRWHEMTESINAKSEEAIFAIAEIHRHAGVSVNMMYGNDGSGSFNNLVPPALRNNFDYSNQVSLRQRGSTAQAAWENIVASELDLLRPLYYAGVDPSPNGGGHAFVCSGYQVDGTSKMFHFNFGWSGYGNGYFTVQDVGGYSQSQAIILNFIPKSENYPYGCTDMTLNYLQGGFEDGSSPIANYGNNLACTWLIDPADTVSSIKLKFTRFDVDQSDKLYIYNGPDENSPLVAELNGTEIPADINVMGSKVFLKFVTDGAGAGRGWEIYYSGNKQAFCSGTKTYKTASGEVSDGSGDEYNYQNNLTCLFKIDPPYATSITLQFTEFDLEDGKDFLKVYKFGESQPMAVLTGNTIPEDITLENGAFYLNFQTDLINTAGGFKANWTIGNVGVGDFPDLKSLTITPNPASDFIRLRAQSLKSNDLKIILSDITGKALITKDLKAAYGDIDQLIDVNKLAPGMYYVTVTDNVNKITEKVIIK